MMVAEFVGFCGECEQKIAEGDNIINRRDERGWVHLMCPDATPKRPEVVCSKCWLMQPCECDA